MRQLEAARLRLDVATGRTMPKLEAVAGAFREWFKDWRRLDLDGVDDAISRERDQLSKWIAAFSSSGNP
jgi:hypothetical protein